MADQPAPLVSEAFVVGEDVAPLIERLEQIIGDAPRSHALIALCSLMLILQHPGISVEEMYEGVKDISRFTCMWLTGLSPNEQQIELEGDLPKEKMN